LTLDSYRVTNSFPRQELFGITSQIRRAAASIGANIAESCGKRGNGEFQRYLSIAAGSASELEYFLLARDLHLLDHAAYTRLDASVVEVKRMLSALVRKVETERLAG
jgi:four helix bundle protein